MLFQRILPPNKIEHLIECYWIVEDNNTIPVKQKIIPDGYPEIIFHYGDPYRIYINGQWQKQGKYLLAGQITRYFFLENTGRTGTFGIKFKPAALTHLYGLSMKDYIDKVVVLEDVMENQFKDIKILFSNTPNQTEIISKLNAYFENLVQNKKNNNKPVDKALELVFKKNGLVTIPELCEAAHIGERQLLNQFRNYIGLSPKYYARIIRLNYIFHLVEKSNERWSSLAYEAAFFDHAHFIKDFKSFTGEKPSKYAFDAKNMANFFLLPEFPKNPEVI